MKSLKMGRLKLSKNKKREKTERPVSFRLSGEAIAQLQTICKALGYSQAQLIELMLHQAIDNARNQYPQEIREAERSLAKKGK